MFKFFYYNIYQLLFSRFLIINFFYRTILIFDKKTFKFFIQNIRGSYDLNTFRQVFIKEEYNLEKTPINLLIKKYYKKKLIIVDCGSNIGASLNYFFLKFPNSKIIGVEPDLRNFQLSKKNIISDNIIIYNSAVSSEKKNFRIVKPVNGDSRAIRIKEIKGDSNKSLTINEILKNDFLKKFSPFIIKIDIEGHEKELFNNNTNWISVFPIIVIEIHDWMISKKNISSNFLKKISKIKNKDIFISGENIVIINYSAVK
jgi:FkbM family methyltransferase